MKTIVDILMILIFIVNYKKNKAGGFQPTGMDKEKERL